MPPADSFVPPAAPAAPPPQFPFAGSMPATGALPPPPPASPDDLGDLLRSYYFAGYYTGLQEARAAAAATAPADQA